MSRWFNVAGPCKADIHYMLSPTSRLPALERLIAQESYFVIHALRQTGKTTAMLALANQLTSSGRYTAVMVSAEVGNPFSHDPGAAELKSITNWISSFGTFPRANRVSALAAKSIRRSCNIFTTKQEKR